jgi:ABC-type transport system involved in multi-copper enzyme maturation permease subunit
MTTPTPRTATRLTTATMRIFELSLGQMLWSRRSVFLAVVVAGPVLLAAGIRVVVTISGRGLPMINGSPVTGGAVFGLLVWLLYIRFIVPVLGVFYGTSLIADEVDDRTITYLFTRPISRAAVFLGKFVAYLTCTALLILPSIVLVYFIVVPLGGGSIGSAFPSLVADLGMLIAGLMAYGALFGLVGTRLRRPLVVGLIFIFGWEPGVLLFPGYLKQATIAYYLQALVPQAMPADDSVVGGILQVFNEFPSVWASLTTLAALTAAALFLAARAVQNREFVLDQ